MHKRTFVLAAVLWLPALSLAQVNTASLTGLAKDSSDAVIPGAKVTATQTATGVERSTLTDATGYYFLANLPIGAYTIAMEKAGFQKAVASVNLDAAEKGRQDFTLAVG